MLYLRPQRVYKPSAASQYNSDDYLAHLLDQMDESLYRLRLETPRGTSITEDNSQITCYAHIFDKRDGTELTDLLKGRGFRPTWLLDGKPIDSARISEEGYLLTLETNHLPAIYQTVTLQARDTDILLALTDEAQDKAWLQRVIASGDIPTHILQASEKLLDIHYLDKLRIDGIEIVKQELSKEIAANTTALEELNKHPLTVSQDGYWRIWDAIKKTYVTTEHQSRGEKGEQGEAGATGEKGPKGDTPKLTLDSQYRLLADGALVSAVSLKGDKGERGERGYRGYQGETGATGEKGPKGDKPVMTLNDKYQLLADGALVSMESLRGPKGDKPVMTLNNKYQLLADGALVSAVSLKGDRGEAGATGEKGPKGDKPVMTLNDKYQLLADGALVSMESLRGPKGDKPVMTLNNKYQLLADGALVSAVSLKGDRGEAGATGEKGPKGDTPKLTLDSQYRLLADGALVSMESLRGPKGDKPTPDEVLGTSQFSQRLTTEVTSMMTKNLSTTNKYIDTAFEYLQNISNQIISSRSYNISTTGYITSHSGTCANVDKNISPGLGSCMPPKENPQIRLTLRSDHDALKRQVDSLSARLAQLEATTKITPVTNRSLRDRGAALFPQYGDWILTSDTADDSISFGGLRAEIGRSIYVQTRKRAYLYSNGHSFYGLPGRSSTRDSQWLSNNTTYRFVRASSDSWLVTASSSPYPWT